VLFIGDDWAEGHHDIELEDEAGRRLARARLPEGLEGITRLHALVAEHAPGSWAELPPDQVAGQVIVGIETDRGPWVTALRAAGYQVFAINPLSAARYRQRHSTSGAKSDAGDAGRHHAVHHSAGLNSPDARQHPAGHAPVVKHLGKHRSCPSRRAPTSPSSQRPGQAIHAPAPDESAWEVRAFRAVSMERSGKVAVRPCADDSSGPLRLVPAGE